MIFIGWPISWKAAGMARPGSSIESCPTSISENHTGTVPAMFMAPTVSHIVLRAWLSIMDATSVGIMQMETTIVVGRKITAVTNTMKMAKRTASGVLAF